ncbi:tRNA 5-methoxyuridine(34) synthase CmoB [Helicobacter enhydrae]|uniref:tRNA 5-methoxyuridine(34) synthase CmoB n=1 Tax=Helicobacter enhydrae TaxID=222136 RepID=A0A1B1U6K8_9HELI|nr:tRNA 5-methoxyuridine(34)/uridine 5-oxyacetic acid(34) synthase CmoB [Helicobacter enhydrae]ANV98399.1 tRNA 5-methoxyuridine(34) synthase CmoB [Helicobacter enhydrae]
MTLQTLREAQSHKLQASNIAPLIKQIASLPNLQAQIHFDESIHLSFPSPLTPEQHKQIYDCAMMLKPWRKGPFQIDTLLIDSEWQSFIKYNIIAPHIKPADKDIADIGCNNGYYLFALLPHSPKSLTGFDPYPLFKCQFDFINHFAQTPINYELLGIEHLGLFPKQFDLILCMGVLYHRTDPIASLKLLKRALREGGEIILDTLIFDSQESIALCPQTSYAKMSNAYFIPSPSALESWCERAGFESVERLAFKSTDFIEQRKTEWIDTMSLQDFLNPCDTSLTIEGYPAPIRGYFKLKRK